jgi:hypothetical protein
MFIDQLFEDDGKKRIVVTYPGRFQPFHKGHAQVFANLQRKFGNENVFIVTGNKTDAIKSPFNFSDKVRFMHAMGIPDHNIIETDKVYDLPAQFQDIRDQLVFITVVGAPDAKRLNPGSIKKDGSPSYFQPMPGEARELQTADKHGYVIVEPEHPEVITVGGKECDVSHGTPCRELWNQIRGNPKQRGEFVQQLYGRADPELAKTLDKIPTGAPEPQPPPSPKLKKVKTPVQPVQEASEEDDNNSKHKKLADIKMKLDHLDKALASLKERQVNEVNPHNYDSDVDYYAALKARNRPRGPQEPEDVPDAGPSAEDEYYARQDRQAAAAKLTEPKQTTKQVDGEAPNGEKYNTVVTLTGPDDQRLLRAAREYADYHWGAKKIVAQQVSPGSLVLYVVDNHRYGYWRPWQDSPVRTNEWAIINKQSQQIIGYLDADKYTKALEKSVKILESRGVDPHQYDVVKAKAVQEGKKKSLRNTNPCWKGYHPVGTKKKNGRTVPNCVPTNEARANTDSARAGLAKRKETKPLTPDEQIAKDRAKFEKWKAKNQKPESKAEVSEGFFGGHQSVGNWFLKKDGDVIRTVNGEPFSFKSKEEALKWAMKNYKISFSQQRIIPTTNPDKNLVTAEDATEVTHRIGVTVIDPNHPMVSKRKEQYQKTVRASGSKEQAITKAINHLRRKGYKVLDHHYIGPADSIAEGDVIHHKFGMKQDQKGKTPYYKNPDIDIPTYDPVAKTFWHAARSGDNPQEPFDRFEVEPAGKTSAHIIGIAQDGRRVKCSTASADLANVLAKAYNRGGFTDVPLQRVPLGEFAPSSGDDGNDGFSDETLKRMAAQWWKNDEDPRIEQALAAAGWEIGQDEGYDNGGVFVVMSGDEHGKSYMSWPSEELEGLSEGGIATVGWPDEGNHTGNMPPVTVGGTFPAKPVVKKGSLVKVIGLSGVHRVMDIRGNQAYIVQEIPNSGGSNYVPMSDLRVWTNKPITRPGLAEGMKADELSRYCEELVAEKGWDAAYKHAKFMAQGNTDPAWGSVLKYLQSMKDGVAEGAELKQAKRKYNQAAKDANLDQVGAGKKIDTMKKSLRQKDVDNKKETDKGVKQDIKEFAPDDGGGSRKFIPWTEFIEQVKQIVGKDFSCKENVVKSTIKARFVPHDPMEYGPTMLYSYYETRAGGRNKGAISTRGSIQVGKYTKGGLFGHAPDQLLTGFHLLKGHPFERHFDLTFDNIYKIANIIQGNTEGALEFQPQKQGVAEGAGNIGNAIKSLYQKIYKAGDDEIDYFYHDSPIFAHYWDEYEGDLDSIIAEVDPKELQIMHDELLSYVQQAGLAEAVTLDRNKNPNYPNDDATKKHRIDTAKAILSDPKSDPDSRKEAAAILAQLSEDGLRLNYKRNRFKSLRKMSENAEELNVGDPVIITGDVEFHGKTGDIDSFGDMKRFVVVNLYNHGKHSFHSSDVSYNDYADEEQDDDMPWHGIKDPALLANLIDQARHQSWEEFYDENSRLLDDPREFWENYHEGELDEDMYQYDAQDPYNSEFAPRAGMGRMTLRGWKQQMIKRTAELAQQMAAAGQDIDKAALWDHVYQKLKGMNMDPIAQEIEQAQAELEKIRQRGGIRARAFKK